MEGTPTSPKSDRRTGHMGEKQVYAKLVKQWGRELANEIMRKRLSTPRDKKGNPIQQSKRGSPFLPGSFENGKRR